SRLDPPTTRPSVARSIRCSTCSLAWPLWRPAAPQTGGRSRSQVPWPTAWLARRLGGSSSSRCGMPFFPRVLEHLVGLDRRVGQRRPVEPPEGQLLEAMAEFEQFGTAAPKLAGELCGGDAPGDAAEDQDQFDRPTLGPPERRAGEGVEDA